MLAQRRGDKLVLRNFDDATRARARIIARDLTNVAASYLGAPRGELEVALAAVDADARDVKVKAGMTKLLLDRCTFDAVPTDPPDELRVDVFRRAAIERREKGHIDRAALIAAVAEARGMTADALERGLYADLKGAHTLAAIDAIAPDALAAAYERGQAQAVLLRAERVVARVVCKSPGALRALFRTLKFHRLLFTALRDGEAHVLGIDGPMSLFEAATKYGPRLAMALPALEACDSLELEAVVRWGKERTRLVFQYKHLLTGSATETEPPLPDEVEALRDVISKGGFNLRVRRSSAILTLPGIGTCVPDLELEDDRGRIAYIEVMGFWSRDAVWNRVELAEKGLGARVVFCVSSRLRVSEEVLPDDLPAALYVYKGSMSARAVAEKAKLLLARKVRTD